ncbi:hypothetical protein FRC12_001622 [Ceratobasidium sp. 428]|nr:hypothetical protein FRC12_001622 [Ceratobasidium sp. 428]
MASGTSVPHLTVTSSPPAPKLKTRRFRFNSQRPSPTEPKPVVATPPTPTTSLPWTKENDDDGRVTFIFGRLKPARVRYSAPPPQTASMSLDASAGTTTIFTRGPSPTLASIVGSRPAKLA